MLEHYSSAHAERVEDLLEWPWMRVERFYSEFVFRETIDRLERQKDMIIAALYANNVFDKYEEAQRDRAISGVEDSFGETIERVRRIRDGKGRDPDDDYDESNPFWAAASRGVDRMEAPRVDEHDAGATAGEMVEGEDSAEEILRMMRDNDQS